MIFQALSQPFTFNAGQGAYSNIFGNYIDGTQTPLTPLEAVNLNDNSNLLVKSIFLEIVGLEGVRNIWLSPGNDTWQPLHAIAWGSTIQQWSRFPGWNENYPVNTLVPADPNGLYVGFPQFGAEIPEDDRILFDPLNVQDIYNGRTCVARCVLDIDVVTES